MVKSTKQRKTRKWFNGCRITSEANLNSAFLPDFLSCRATEWKMTFNRKQAISVLRIYYVYYMCLGRWKMTASAFSGFFLSLFSCSSSRLPQTQQASTARRPRSLRTTLLQTKHMLLVRVHCVLLCFPATSQPFKPRDLFLASIMPWDMRR